jgi:hypothetical protein
MADGSSHWAAPSLARHKPVILALTAIALGWTIYQVRERQLEERIAQWDAVQDDRHQPSDARRPSLPPHFAEEALRRRGALAGPGAVTDVDSEPSRGANGKADQHPQAGNECQSLLNLLYRISEDRARKEGYVHRRVSCNGCDAMPIKGIRYHCANCLDFDLCELCEAKEVHPKTHLFYKIRIPAPFLGHPRQPEPVQYPGKPAAAVYDLTNESIKRLCNLTGYQSSEVEAFWEQFRCLAAAEWPDDPGHYNLAIDRQTFDKCFIPNTSIRPPPSNPIYDRMFRFYDQNDDGLIGFDEFIRGLASLTNRNTDGRLRRIFDAYDNNDDGFVERKDFLEMFKGYYAATNELTQDVLADMEEEVSENGVRDIVLGNQPMSSAFAGSIPAGEPSRAGQGKMNDSYGDLRIRDNVGAVEDSNHDLAEPDVTIADAAEVSKYGNIRPKNMIGFVDFSTIYSAPWPPSEVTRIDVEDALLAFRPLEEVTRQQDRYAIRRMAHARLARDHQERQYVRRIAIREKRARRVSNIDREAGDMRSEVVDTQSLWIYPPASDDEVLTSNFLLVLRSDQYDAFCKSLIEGVKELRWPLGSPNEVADEALRLLSNGWTASALTEDFSGYAINSNDSKKLVKMLYDRLSEFVKQLRPEARSEKAVESLPSSRRSRSSSKVRFQDDLATDDEHEARSVTSMSARSIPVNERWGGLEVRAPETDVGREVLYQTTEEALDELLDPVFRLREDLGLAARNDMGVRDQHRAEIITAVEDCFNLKQLLDRYQRRWRRDSYFTINLDSPERDEAKIFLQFLNDNAADVTSNLTAENCPCCAQSGAVRWVKLGEKCLCGYLSKGRPDERIPPEPCPTCAEKGLEAYIGGSPGARCCQNGCGTRSAQYYEEEARLRAIISGGEPVITDHQHHNAPKGSEQPRDETSQDSTSSANTEAVKDLAKSIAAFNEANPPSLEQSIAQKLLDALLQEAGYAAIPSIGPSRSPSPPLDPTLPQNMPNSATTVNHTRPQDPPRNLTELTAEQREALDDLANNHSLAAATTLPPLLSPLRDNSSLVEQLELLGKLQEGRDCGKGPDGPDKETLRWYACLDFIKAEDDERGGPGRLNYQEWEEVMKGDKGQSLGFLGSWIEMASF